MGRSSNQRILEKAIKKAIDGGWEVIPKSNTDWNVHKGNDYAGMVLCIPNHETKTKIHLSQSVFIFNHDFAKALWGHTAFCKLSGEKAHKHLNHYDCSWDDKCDTQEAWEHHLQRMVIAKDVIQYLEENIGKA